MKTLSVVQLILKLSLMDNFRKWYDCVYLKSLTFRLPSINTCFSTNCYKSECSLMETCRQERSVPYKFLQTLLCRKAFCESGKTLSPPAPMDRKEEETQEKTGRAFNVVSEIDVQNYLSNETGRDRLIKMCSTDHKGQLSPEMELIKTATIQSAAGTFLCMSMLAGRQAKNDFITRNRVTVFKTRFQAFRRLQDTIFLFSMKEGAKWGARVSIFSLIFLLTSQSIAVYRNKSSVWEYTVASALTIGLFKANMGLRGFVVGTGFGAVIGSLGGVVLYAAMKITNETQEQRHYWQVQRELENRIIQDQLASNVVTAAA